MTRESPRSDKLLPFPEWKAVEACLTGKVIVAYNKDTRLLVLDDGTIVDASMPGLARRGAISLLPERSGRAGRAAIPVEDVFLVQTGKPSGWAGTGTPIAVTNLMVKSMGRMSTIIRVQTPDTGAHLAVNERVLASGLRRISGSRLAALAAEDAENVV